MLLDICLLLILIVRLKYQLKGVLKNNDRTNRLNRVIVIGNEDNRIFFSTLLCELESVRRFRFIQITLVRGLSIQFIYQSYSKIESTIFVLVIVLKYTKLRYINVYNLLHLPQAYKTSLLLLLLIMYLSILSR